MGEKCESGRCECRYGSEEKCGCNKSCSCGSCKSECCEENDKMGMMMYLVKEAKMELIKEKVKRKLETAEGKKLDKVADLLVEAMMGYYKTKIDIADKKQEMHEKFGAIFKED